MTETGAGAVTLRWQSGSARASQHDSNLVAKDRRRRLRGRKEEIGETTAYRSGVSREPGAGTRGKWKLRL
ncbi:hypothetical protein E2562_035051 [Oryza meyeriana var. granulata]|uniref:Uncharacterized protein n=1 Tax=Oryza meyeriana var. granulata TaxID=110450 RepID=A0A6G1CL05_9ORYZ|nr:hypothetical protein E2562_035051 [Oryza meyeriana var. granulata]